MTDTNSIDETLARWQRNAAIVTVVAVALCGLETMTNVEQILRSYLLGFLFWWSVTMGCLGLLMLYHLVGGRWGAAVKPFLECGSLTAPLTAVLFLPVAMGIGSIYPWANTDAVVELRKPAESSRTWKSAPEFAALAQENPQQANLRDDQKQHLTSEQQLPSQQKAWYLNPRFLYGRAVAYFVIWSALALLLRQRIADVEPNRQGFRPLLSAVGLVALILSVTFASIDWAMSLDPAWYSSIYGALVVIGGAMAGLAWVSLMFAVIEMRRGSESSVDASATLGDLGTLLLAFLMLWAYFAFSQFLIIWAGNLPEENVWYVNRLHGGWQWIGLAVVVFQFGVPFLMLLSRDWKQDPRSLGFIAALIFVMQFFYCVWTISPSFYPEGLFIHWADVVAPLAIGGLWVSAFLWLVRRCMPPLLDRNAQ